MAEHKFKSLSGTVRLGVAALALMAAAVPAFAAHHAATAHTPLHRSAVSAQPHSASALRHPGVKPRGVSQAAIVKRKSVGAVQRHNETTYAHASSMHAGRRSGEHVVSHGRTLFALRHTETEHTSKRGKVLAEVATSRGHLRPAPRIASAKPVEGESVEDRVHSWYRMRQTSTLTPSPANLTAPVSSATARKAADENAEVSAEKLAHQTTAEDDNAAAVSRIPSTAPTERVASPFEHGLQTGTPGDAAAKKSVLPTGTGISSLAVSPAVVPKPPTNASPAVAAIRKDASRPKLDDGVAAGMIARTFDDEDEEMPTAATAVQLAKQPAVLTPASGAARTTSPARLVGFQPSLFDASGQLLLVAPMRGSHEILMHQNLMAMNDGLDRVMDNRDLLALQRRRMLSPLPNEQGIFPDSRLPYDRRFARPWAVSFLREMAHAHYSRFGTPLVITSAVRTVAFQKQLIRRNGNAAPPTGEVASPHLYGQAVDIGKRGMSLTELTWMRAYLTPLVNAGKIDVEEEFQQSCFHISVYRRYTGDAPTQPSTPPPAQMLQTSKSAPAPAARKRRVSVGLLATGLR